MPATLGVEVIDTLKPRARDLLRDAARKLAHLRYADLRVEVVEARYAAAENGAARGSGDETTLASACACSPASARWLRAGSASRSAPPTCRTSNA